MRKHKIIFKVTVLLLLIVSVSFAVTNSSYALISDGNGGLTTSGGGAQFLGEIIGIIINTSLGSIGSALSAVVLLIVAIGYMLLFIVFVPITGNIPTIDGIIFNKMAFFDPNFISPSTNSFAGYLKPFMQKVYTTGYLVAGSIFVIGAMVIGMKLAVSSIASEKAHYKEMVGTWLKGLLLLFTVHIIVAGVFYLNEMVVSKLEVAFDLDSVTFETSIFNNTVKGKILEGLVSLVENFTPVEINTDISLPGIGGLIMVLTYNGIVKSDILSAVAVAALLGQTFSLIVIYVRRLIICMALGALAPYIVAVDFIKKLI